MVTVTNAAGSGSSADPFTLENFHFDFTQEALPPSVTAIRSQSTTLWVPNGAGAVQIITGADVPEDFGDGRGRGRRSFPSYKGVTDPNDFVTGWTKTNLVEAAGDPGPDGVTVARKFADASGSTTAQLTYFGTPEARSGQIAICWIKDDGASPPDGSPSAAIGARGDFQFYRAVPNGVAWKIAMDIFSLGASTYTPFVDLRFVGAVPTAGGASNIFMPDSLQTLTFQHAKTGAIHVCLFNSQDQINAVLPIVAGIAGNCSYRLRPAGSARALGTLLESGDMDIDVCFGSDYARSLGGGTNAAPWYIYSLDTPNGLIGATWEDATVRIKFNGSDSGSLACFARHGLIVRLRQWYEAAGGGDRGHMVFINGCRVDSAHQQGHITLATPTDGYVGSRLGIDGFAPIPHYSPKKGSGDRNVVEGVVLGDSLTGGFSGNMQPTAQMIYQGAEALERLGIVSYATAGERLKRDVEINDQYRRWMNCAQRGQSYLRWVILNPGHNDISDGKSLVDLIADATLLTADINTQNPGCKVVWMPLLPTSWAGEPGTPDPGRRAIQDGFNAAIAADAFGVMSHMPPWTSAGGGQLGNEDTNTGTDTLRTIYLLDQTLVDLVHENQLCRDIISAAKRAHLLSIGELS